MRHFLTEVIKVDGPSTWSIYKIIKKKTHNRSEPLEKAVFSRSLAPVLKEIEIEQVREFLRESLSVETHGHKDQ